MKKTTLLKTLLVAVALCVGTSAWATITTTTYDFTSWVAVETSISLSSTSTDAYRQKVYVPETLNDASHFNSNFAFRLNTAKLTTAGLVLPKDNFIALLNLTAGDKIIINFTGTAQHIHNRSGNYPEYSNMTTDGTEISGSSSVSVVSGTTYWDYRDSRVAIRPTNDDFTITSITVKHNDSESYAKLFSLWTSSATTCAAAAVSTEKTTFQTAINAAKTVIANESATDDDYNSAYTALREASELFTANTTLNNSYRTTSSSVMDDGTNVKSVYGITMTYHGSWSWTDARNGNAAAATDPQSSESRSHNVPTGGEYIELNPTVGGLLTLKFAWYNGSYYCVADENGHFIFNIKQSGGNDYSNYKDAGYLEAGKTYYVYKSAGGNGYQFGGFTFTPGDNTTTSYAVSSGENVAVDYSITSVKDITMTYGGAAESTWTVTTAYSSTPGTYNNGGNATVTSYVPSAGTFVKFVPTANGVLTVKYVGYSLGANVSVKLNDGTKEEIITIAKGESNGIKTKEFSTILETGETYYVYFSGGGYNSHFCGFTFNTEVSKNITSAGWATYCSPYALDLEHATGLTDAYIVTGGADGVLDKTSVKSGTVPANTGLLIKGAAGTATIPVVASSETSVSANKLVGVTTNTEIAANAGYVLMASPSLGFYKNSNAFTVGANTAYLPANFDGESARSFFSFDDDATGVHSIDNGKLTIDNDVYDLQGRRVAQPTKGLYIVNGKKVVIK